MEIINTRISEVKILIPEVFGDDRGFFMETWRENWFHTHISKSYFVQENHSYSRQGVLRGLHYQTDKPQGKLVRVITGSVFDVAVDMRKSSNTFGQWVGVLLSDENKSQLWIPEGFAHGFYVTSKTAELVYRCTNYYNSAAEQSVRWDDPDLAIDWPLVNGIAPLISAKDTHGDWFKDAFTF